MALGVRNSYATDTPLQNNYIGQAMQTVEDNAFRARQEKRIEDDAKAKKAKEEEDKIAEHLKTYKVDLTGSQSFDDLAQATAFDHFNTYADLARKLQVTTNPNERLKLKTEQARLDQNIGSLKQIPGILKDKAEFIAKNIDKLNPEDVDIIQEKLGALEKGNAKVFLDENKIPKINIYKTDENGKVTGILESEQDLAGFINSITPHGKSKYQDIIKDAIANTGYQTTASQSGANIVSSKVVPEEVKNKTAMSVADLVYANPDERYVVAKRLGVPETDEKAIKTAVANDYKAGLDNENKQSLDTSYLNYKLAKKKDEKDEIKVNVITFDNNRRDDFIPDNAKGKFVSANTLWTNGLGFSKPVKVTNIGGELSGLNGAEVLGVTKDKATGDFIFTGRALIDKGKKFKTQNGELIGLMEMQKKLSDTSIPDDEKYNLQAQMDSYSTGANYGNFTRRIANQDNVNQILSAVGYDIGKANKELARLNPNEGKSASNYSNVQEGQINGKTVQIGYKNGKWYDTKTGKAIE